MIASIFVLAFCFDQDSIHHATVPAVGMNACHIVYRALVWGKLNSKFFVTVERDAVAIRGLLRSHELEDVNV